MATPSYKGSNQPELDNGFWSGFGSWLGGGATPAYAGDSQPSPSSTGILSSAPPGYKSPPSAAQAQVIGPSGFPPGPFAIVVPRGLVPPCDGSDPQP